MAGPKALLASGGLELHQHRITRLLEARIPSVSGEAADVRAGCGPVAAGAIVGESCRVGGGHHSLLVDQRGGGDVNDPGNMGRDAGQRPCAAITI